MADSVDPDQTALTGAVLPGSALFPQTCLSQNLGFLLYSLQGHIFPKSQYFAEKNSCFFFTAKNIWATSWENMRTTKAQISLRIRAVWSAPLLFAA